MSKEKRQSKFSIRGLIFKIISFGFFIWAINCFLNDHPFYTTILIVFGLIFMWSGKDAVAKKEADNATARYLKSSQNGEKLVNLVKENKEIEKLINNKSFANSGVKLVVINQNDECSLILTRKCIYENILGSYDFPKDGVTRIKFEKGEEFVATQRHQMDVGKMANAGFMAGGLGVAAMNAADAMEANANGGAEVGVKSGNFGFNLNVSGTASQIYVVIIRKDYVEKFGNPFHDRHVREGSCYNAYYVSLMKGGRCEEAGKQMTKLLNQIQQAD